MKLLEFVKRAILSEPLPSFMDLPTELILQIIEELDEAALCALGSTCKGLDNLIFPFFFKKHKITNPSQGWITCYRVPQYTLRAIRCWLSTKDIYSIHYYFSKGVRGLVEEVEEMHAVVRRTDRVTDLKLYLTEPDDWAVRDAPRLDEAQVLPLTSEEWTRLYLGLLTTSLTKECKNILLSGGHPFLKYLQHREQNADGSVSANLLSRHLRTRVRRRQAIRYFGGGLRDVGVSVDHPKGPPTVENVEATPVIKARKKRSRPEFLKWIDSFILKKEKTSGLTASSTGSTELKIVETPSPVAVAPKQTSQLNVRGFTRPLNPPSPMLQRLILQSDMFLATPSFLDWTNQLLSWWAPTITHFELQCTETPSETWRVFFSGVTLPSLTEFNISSNLVVGDANIQGRDILAFLSRHPNIQNLSLHGIEVPRCALPDLGKPILPNLVQVLAHPMYIRWLLRGEEQCPKLKKLSLLTEYYLDRSRPFAYDALDNALEDLLSRSHNLDLTLRFTNDHLELDSWLQSHIDAGPNASILSNFIDTKRLQINCAYYVKLLTSPTRRELVAQFLGLFPNLEHLELEEQAGLSFLKEDSCMEALVEALQLHCPQVKTMKVHNSPAINIEGFAVERQRNRERATWKGE